ncbi:DUF58 domain-containing protein [Pedococcus dokdonensis]|uniref:DUF58 domain-containing protein n=1 Tax=Pedococcus dokdonensis TaxID=443156 RepID=UPI0012FD7B71|nr:DUF58 domain-containing protein [Pedococcus dokdonensis]
MSAGYPTVRGLGLALLALEVVSLASVLLRLPVSVHRTIAPSRVARLDPCQGRLALTSSSGRFGVSLDAQDRVGGRPVDIDVPWLAPGETREVVFDLPTERMGRLAIGPMTLRRNGFAGLWLRVMDLGDTRDLLVTPQLHRCTGVPSGLTRGHAGADERVERGGTDLTGLREYVPGDDLRRLHWATTARTGTLMIREDSDPSRAHLTVLVDDSPASTREPGDLDEMADVAASLLRAAVADGNPCRLVSISGRADVDLPAGIGVAVDPVGVLEPALVALCDLAAEIGPQQPAIPALHGTDVLVVVGSRHSDRTRLATIAGGLRPTLLLVDPTAEAPITWAAGAATLSGARARDVLATWDAVRS